jgi:hypothetical protein
MDGYGTESGKNMIFCREMDDKSVEKDRGMRRSLGFFENDFEVWLFRSFGISLCSPAGRS